MIKNIRIAVLSAGICCSASVFAGSVLTLETTEYTNDPPVVSTTEISTQEGSSRMESTTGSSNESGGMIFHGASDEMIALDHEKKEYYVLDEASMDRMATQLSSAMQQMQKALEDMPPDQRAMAEQMMKQHMPSTMQQPQTPPATLQKTGKDGSFNGFDCEFYEVRREEVKLREICVTGWDAIAGGREVADAMLEMAGFFEGITKTFSEGSGVNIMGERQDIFAHMRELDGYPVLTREFDDAGNVEVETVLKSATTEGIDAEYFNPPADYTEMELGM